MTSKPSRLYVLQSDYTGELLCRDNQWRAGPNCYGTKGRWVRLYKQRAAAVARAGFVASVHYVSYGTRRELDGTTILNIDDGR